MLNNYDWKNIIKRVIIGVGIAFILFNINKCNAYALVYKQNNGRNPTFTNRTIEGTISTGQYKSATFQLSSNLTLNQDYDFLGIQLTFFDFNYSGAINISGSIPTTYCDTYGYYDKYYVCPGGDCAQTVTYKQITCKHVTSSSSTGNLSGTVTNLGDVYSVYAIAVNSSGVDFPVLFTADNENVIFLPTEMVDLNRIVFFVRNHATTTLSYHIELDDIKAYYNYDTTEIINSLNGIQTQQQQTNTIITNTDTSSSSNSANTGFNNMNSQISQQVDSLASVNTYNNIVNNFFTQINNSTCSPISLPMPFVQGKNIVLPCIGTEIQNSAPALWTFWRFMCAGIIGFALWGNMITFIKGVVDPYNIGANNLPIGGGK